MANGPGARDDTCETEPCAHHGALPSKESAGRADQPDDGECSCGSFSLGSRIVALGGPCRR
jgi:hypothetical protein